MPTTENELKTIAEYIKKDLDNISACEQIDLIMDMFDYISIERPGPQTWLVEVRVNLQDDLVQALSNISRTDAIVKVALKVIENGRH